jgi:hydroxymethylpyrimidine pyrophosphatase-like HAD family hydrolase
MTGRIGAMSIDGTLISEADVARMNAEEALHAEWQRKAARVVAAGSRDVADCRELLAMLGLDTQVIADARRALPAAVKPARKRRAKAA